ncbi:uncharacterized protein LOC115887090 [Sitophilus oryzae]|uniref:Uncharacterized protein LOC115887090 n=1 Tax=Sitophilus oryzae TaxID=7048 RepID=A0A6J2YHB0_SITOR|nr:uncharacterized protein LOC115887090 [Sitophilus oryzae]
MSLPKKCCIIGLDGRVINDLDDLMDTSASSASELQTTAAAMTLTEIEIFLKSNGIYDEIYPVLEAYELDSIELLSNLLKSEEFKELFPSLKLRLKLREALRKHEDFESQKSKVPAVVDIDYSETISLPTLSSTPITEPCTSGAQKCFQERTVLFLSSEENNVGEVTANRSSPSRDVLNTIKDINPSKRIRLDIQSLNLPQLLEESITGKALVAIYNKYQEFEPKYQGYLCDVIVQHFLNQPTFQRLTNEDFDAIADNIITVFPKEVKTTYFIEPLKKKFSKENKSGFARGKLTDKYRNRLTFLRKAGLISSQRETGRRSDDADELQVSLSISIEDQTKNDLLWLQHNTEPWHTVEEKWKSTFKYRKNLLESSSIPNDELTKIFNILKNPMGHTLIDWDFKELHEESYGKLFSGFDNIFKILVDLRRKTLNKNEHLLLDIIENPQDNFASNTREYIQLSLLISLLPPKQFKRCSKAWIPSTDECKEGIVSHVKIPGDIPKAIEDKKKKLAKYGLTLQPFVIIEGASYNNISNVYVSFNNILYKVNSVLKGVDTCFQIITIFDLKYPYEAEHVWLFLQKSVYNIHTKYDNIPNILDIINKIKNRS